MEIVFGRGQDQRIPSRLPGIHDEIDLAEGALNSSPFRIRDRSSLPVRGSSVLKTSAGITAIRSPSLTKLVRLLRLIPNRAN
jgi:hypothetical protein